MEAAEIDRLAGTFENETPEAVIAWAFDHFGPKRVIHVNSFQEEGMVLLDMAWRLCPGVRVVTIDTGRLPRETYDLIQTVRERYSLQVEVLFPDRQRVEQMVTQHGPNLFYDSVQNRLQCCEVRKVEPLARALKTAGAWITGLRRDQWVTRADIRKVETDETHAGIVKLNPLADWSEEDLRRYSRAHDLPYNKLYDRGYRSIGCDPCTRPVAEGEPARLGRWWWEEEQSKECGIHVRHS